MPVTGVAAKRGQLPPSCTRAPVFSGHRLTTGSIPDRAPLRVAQVLLRGGARKASAHGGVHLKAVAGNRRGRGPWVTVA